MSRRGGRHPGLGGDRKPCVRLQLSCCRRCYPEPHQVSIRGKAGSLSSRLPVALSSSSCLPLALVVQQRLNNLSCSLHKVIPWGFLFPLLVSLPTRILIPLSETKPGIPAQESRHLQGTLERGKCPSPGSGGRSEVYTAALHHDRPMSHRGSSVCQRLSKGCQQSCLSQIG